jgi:hypothetical protein
MLKFIGSYLDDQGVAIAFEAHDKETACIYDFLHQAKGPIAQIDQVETIGLPGHKGELTVVSLATGYLQFRDGGCLQGEFGV